MVIVGVVAVSAVVTASIGSIVAVVIELPITVLVGIETPEEKELPLIVRVPRVYSKAATIRVPPALLPIFIFVTYAPVTPPPRVGKSIVLGNLCILRRPEVELATPVAEGMTS
jgi:hypothetical protein